jgi:hypothetical protein
MKSNTLSLDIETLVELTPEDARQVNGGLLTSSAMPSPATGVVHPTPTAVSSAKPPAKHHKHHKKPVHHTVSSVMPTPPVHI